MTLPNVDELKAQAKRLRTAMPTIDGKPVGHSKALELIARQHGYRDWNTLHAAAGNGSNVPVSLGERVTGDYLHQPFTGEVISAARLGLSGRYRMTIKFDEPVDVVTFDSFSAFRSRVTAVVDQNGVTSAKTSDGNPHMRVRRLSS